ncbi:hypothetical protein [Paraburkholderia terrae]|uniref:Uncharacterized protein n=1 Tax=Paraburkholderia terrae TaxID=311230 RepID=A0A2I8EZM3_9BURK|nr:hypothetical protein [Paraburkholderia terrae]AUT64950.1 hypothetical protein C2L65_35700 [Paraburkholderia terrae]
MKEAAIRITIDVYSGRENPVLEFSGRKLQDIAKRLQPDKRNLRREAGIPKIPTLGYRGLVVEQSGVAIRELPAAFRIMDGIAIGPDFAVPIEDAELEYDICGSVPKPFVPEDIRKQLSEFRELLDFWRRWHWDGLAMPPFHLALRCRCGPVYEPGWWNVPTRQPNNNCYNYACNYRTDTFAQPGRAAGAMYTALTCPSVRPAAIADALIDNSGADNRCPPEGHLVALVIWPNGDFHWYRKGRDGFWTHKPGPTAVTNLDNSGNLIIDPRTANRGPYTDFCTFMTVQHGHIKIN